jgi:hypothetical protein
MLINVLVKCLTKSDSLMLISFKSSVISKKLFSLKGNECCVCVRHGVDNGKTEK